MFIDSKRHRFIVEAIVLYVYANHKGMREDMLRAVGDILKAEPAEYDLDAIEAELGRVAHNMFREFCATPPDVGDPPSLASEFIFAWVRERFDEVSRANKKAASRG